jgi:hypothetical protein
MGKSRSNWTIFEDATRRTYRAGSVLAIRTDPGEAGKICQPGGRRRRCRPALSLTPGGVDANPASTGLRAWTPVLARNIDPFCLSAGCALPGQPRLPLYDRVSEAPEAGCHAPHAQGPRPSSQGEEGPGTITTPVRRRRTPQAFLPAGRISKRTAWQPRGRVWPRSPVCFSVTENDHVSNALVP